MAGSLLGVGISGLNAAQLGLLTTSHNISNANTRGFSRQQILQGTNNPLYTGAGFLGRGVNVANVQRIYSEFLTTQVRQDQAQASHLAAYYDSIRQIDNVLADRTAGLTPSLEEFFRSVQNLSAHPGDGPARASVLGSSQALAARFQQLSTRLQSLRDDANARISSSVNLINTYTSQIAEINRQISLAQASGGGQQLPNDLLDQRDTLLRQLSEEIGINTVAQSDGTINVFLSNGQAVVVGDQNNRLQALPDTQNPQDTQVALQIGSTITRFRSADLTGGNLGGALAFRDQSLGSAQNALGRIGLVLANEINLQHQLGQDLTGALGGTFFNLGSPTSISATTNTGTGVLAATISNYSALTTSDYRVSYDGANYTITRLSDNTSQSFAALPATVDGVQITLSAGTPNAGDSFLVQPTRTGARDFSVAITDASRIAAAAPIRTAAASANTGTGSISQGSVNYPPPPNPNLRNTVRITFTGPNTYDVFDVTTSTTLATGVAYTPGTNITYNGWTAAISGSPRTGDQFTVSANTSGQGDGRNALLLAALQSKNVLGGTLTFTGAYGSLVGEVGSKTRELELNTRSQTNLLVQTEQRISTVSGVNLDEEAANLIRYQQAYQASSKVIAMAGNLFQEIIDIMK